jgi:hypothetical protein
MAILSDPNVPASAFCIAHLIERLSDNRWGVAFFEQETLAQAVQLSDKRTRDLLWLLAELGWVEILSGSDCIRKKARLNYRPTWPSADIKKASIGRKAIGTWVPVTGKRTGKKLPVSDAREPEVSGRSTGHFRAANRTKTSGTYIDDLPKDSLKNDGERSGALHHNSSNKSESESSETGTSLRTCPSISGREAHYPVGRKDFEQDSRVRAAIRAYFVELHDDPAWDAESEAKLVLETYGHFPSAINVNDACELLAFDSGFCAAMGGAPREVTEPFTSFDRLTAAWIVGYDDFARRKAEGCVPGNIILF